MKTTRFKEDRILPIRLASRSSLALWQQSFRLWNIVIMSLPFDLLILLTNLSLTERSSSLLKTLATALLVPACLGLAREPLLDFFDFCRKKYELLTAQTQNYSWIAIVIAVGLLIFEALSRFGELGLLVLIGASLLALKVGSAARDMIFEYRQHRDSLEADKTLLLDHLNLWLYFLSIIPILAARLSMLAAAIASQNSSEPAYSWGPQALTCIVLLFALMPSREHFIIQCKRCARWTSRALKNIGYCPLCAREEFQVNHEIFADQSARIERKSDFTLVLKERIRSFIANWTGSDRER